MNELCKPCKFEYHGIHGTDINKHKISIERFIREACEYFDEDYNDVVSLNRKSNLVDVRHMIMVFLSRHKKFGLKEIASGFNKLNHSTIVHAKKQVAKLCDSDADYKFNYDRLCIKLSTLQ